MAYPKIKLSDDSGNAVGVTDNRLNVNAYLAATPTIDIGDVSLLLGGTAASTNAGTMDAQTLRVTLATDDTHWGTVGTAADSDGTAHGQLRYIATQAVTTVTHVASIVSHTSNTATLLNTIDGDTGNMVTALQIMDDWDATHDGSVSADGAQIMAEAKVIDGSALPNSTAEGDAIRIAATRGGVLYSCLSSLNGQKSPVIDDDDGQVSTPSMINVGGEYRSGDTTYGDGDATILQTNVNGALKVVGTVDLGTTDNGVLDAIASSLEILDDWDDSNYANVNINLAGSDAPTGGGTESGALRVTLANDSTGVISIDDGGNTITVDGTVTANLGTTDNGVLDAIAASLALLDNSIASGNELQVDVVAALPAGTNAIGKLAANSGVDIGDVDVTSISAGTNAIGKVGHDITGMVSGVNADIDTSAEQLDGGTDGYDVACKRVDLKASPDNTDDIWVGDSGVLANGLGGGIRLSPGDFYSIDIDNLTDIWVIGISADQKIHFNYFT